MMFRRFNPLSSRKNRSYCSSIYSRMALKLSELLMASPKPGVSTTVRRSFTPRSSISTVDASSFRVCFCFSINEIIEESLRPKDFKSHQWRLEQLVPDTSQSRIANSPTLTFPIPIRQQSSAWTRSLSLPTYDEPDWGGWRSPHTQPCRAMRTETNERKKVHKRKSLTRHFQRTKNVISDPEVEIISSFRFNRFLLFWFAFMNW